MVEKTSEVNAAHQETIEPGDPAQAKAPVAALNEALPDDQSDDVFLLCPSGRRGVGIDLMPAIAGLGPAKGRLLPHHHGTAGFTSALTAAEREPSSAPV
jgi:hypothetical protein